MISSECKVFEKLLKKRLSKTISFYDKYESFYHGFMIGVISGFDGFSIKSNREAGDGRADIILSEISDHNTAVIIEIKTAEKYALLNTACDESLRQIDEKNYDAGLIYECYKIIIKYGVAFNGKSCKVKMKHNKE